MKLIFSILVAMFCVHLQADNSELVGVTADGWSISASGEGGQPMIIMLSKKNKSGEYEYINYENEICTIDSGEAMELKCKKDNKSPLAGTHYKSKKNDNSCNIILYCVSGCEENARAPKTMTRYGSFCGE